jgi:hypothetical protein
MHQRKKYPPATITGVVTTLRSDRGLPPKKVGKPLHTEIIMLKSPPAIFVHFTGASSGDSVRTKPGEGREGEGREGEGREGEGRDGEGREGEGRERLPFTTSPTVHPIPRPISTAYRTNLSQVNSEKQRVRCFALVDVKNEAKSHESCYMREKCHQRPRPSISTRTWHQVPSPRFVSPCFTFHFCSPLNTQARARSTFFLSEWRGWLE